MITNEYLVSKYCALKTAEVRGFARQAARNGATCVGSYRDMCRAYSVPSDSFDSYVDAYHDERGAMGEV